MDNLKARLERLEATTPKPRKMTIIVVSSAGELRGFHFGAKYEHYLARQTGESEDALQARAAEAARGPRGMAVLIEDRAPPGG